MVLTSSSFKRSSLVEVRLQLHRFKRVSRTSIPALSKQISMPGSNFQLHPPSMQDADFLKRSTVWSIGVTAKLPVLMPFVHQLEEGDQSTTNALIIDA